MRHGVAEERGRVGESYEEEYRGWNEIKSAEERKWLSEKGSQGKIGSTAGSR